MPASKQLKILSVRLPEPEFRHFKSIAAARGISVQEAVHQALEAWISEFPKASLESLAALEGSLASVDVESLMRREKELELAKDQRWS
jgi:hypothetical protein